MTQLARRLPYVTLVALFGGYAASYFHRADLATIAPLWAADPRHTALRAAWPDLASLGMLVYALGKLLGGILAERFGGRVVFPAALAGAGAAELVAMHADDVGTFAACRVAGMVVLGCAWPALGQVVANVTPVQRLATVMAFLSQSYLLGDAAVRALLAAVVARGGDAHAVFGTAATGLLTAAGIVAMTLWCTRRPHATGNPSPAATATATAPPGVLRLLLALAAMNFALALVREALSLWTPLLLVERCGLPADAAVRASALLPLASGAGALLAGPLADRGPRTLLAVTLLPALLAAIALGTLAAASAPALPFVLGATALASALLVMPMTLASGVLPLRIARTGGARRLGFVDGAGSFGAVLAGSALARVQTSFGANGMFAGLAAVATLAAAFAFVVHRHHVART